MAVFGELLSLYNDSGAIVFVIVMVFLMTFEGILHIVEVECTKRGYKALIKKLYREFMIMGFISFGILITTETTGVATNDKWYVAFHFAHVVIMFVGITFLVQAGTLVSLISFRNHTLLTYDSCTSESLLIEYLHVHEQSPILMKVFNYGPISIPFPRLREKIEFKILQYFFIRSYHLPFEFKFANYMCMVLKNYVIALVEVRPISWLIVAAFIALNYGRIRLIDPIYESAVCRTYVDDDKLSKPGLTDFQSTAYMNIPHDIPLLQRMGRRLSEAVSETYHRNVCEEYTLRVAFILCCMTTLYLICVLIASEIYIQRLVDRVLDVEEIFAYLDENPQDLNELNQQRASVLMMNSQQQQQLLHTLARKRASSSADGLPPPILTNPNVSSTVTGNVASTPRASSNMSTITPPSVTNPSNIGNSYRRIPSAQNMNPLEEGIAMMPVSNIEDDCLPPPETSPAAPAPTKEFKPLLLHQYSRASRNSFKVLEDRKSLDEDRIQQLRQIIDKSHSKWEGTELHTESPDTTSMPPAAGRSRGNSFFGSITGSSGKFGNTAVRSQSLPGSYNAPPIEIDTTNLDHAPDRNASLPDISHIRREFSIEARSSFSMADILPPVTPAIPQAPSNKIRIFGKHRRYLYLKCLDRIMQEEYIEHARAAKRASVLDPSTVGTTATTTGSMTSSIATAALRARSLTTIDPHASMTMSTLTSSVKFSSRPASTSRVVQEEPSPSTPKLGPSGSTLERLFRSDSPTNHNYDTNETIPSTTVSNAATHPTSYHLNNQAIKDMKIMLKQTRNTGSVSAPPGVNATSLPPLLRGNSISSTQSGPDRSSTRILGNLFGLGSPKQPQDSPGPPPAPESRGMIRRYSISEASSPDAIMPEYLRGLGGGRAGSTIESGTEHGGHGGDNHAKMNTMHKHASTITTRSVRGMTNFFESLPSADEGDHHYHDQKDVEEHQQPRWWTWPLYRLLKWNFMTYGVPFFASMQRVMLGHHLGLVVTSAIQDKDIVALQEDLKSIFLFGKPSLYYFVIEIGLLLQCLYVALWSTNLVVIINDSHYVALWHIAFLVPMACNIWLLKQTIFTSVILKSIVNIDQFVANRICEEAFNERLVIQRIRKLIREKLSDITLDRKFWKYILFHKFLEYSTDVTGEVTDMMIAEHQRLDAEAEEEATRSSVAKKKMILTYMDKAGNMHTLPSYLNMKTLQLNTSTMNVDQWELFLRAVKIFLTPASIKQHFDVLDSDKDGQLTWSMISKIVFPELQKKQIKLGKKGHSKKSHKHHGEEGGDPDGTHHHKHHRRRSNTTTSVQSVHTNRRRSLSTGGHGEVDDDIHEGLDSEEHSSEQVDTDGQDGEGKKEGHPGEKEELTFEYELTPSMMEALKDYRNKQNVSSVKRGSLLTAKAQTLFRKSIFYHNTSTTNMTSTATTAPPLPPHVQGSSYLTQEDTTRKDGSDDEEEDRKSKQQQEQGSSGEDSKGNQTGGHKLHHPLPTHTTSGDGHHSKRQSKHQEDREDDAHRHYHQHQHQSHHEEEEDNETEGHSVTQIPFAIHRTSQNAHRTLPSIPSEHTRESDNVTISSTIEPPLPHPPLTTSSARSKFSAVSSVSDRTMSSWNTHYSSSERTNASSSDTRSSELSPPESVHHQQHPFASVESSVKSTVSSVSFPDQPQTSKHHPRRRGSLHPHHKKRSGPHHHHHHPSSQSIEEEEEGGDGDGGVDLDDDIYDEEYDSDDTLFEDELERGVHEDDNLEEEEEEEEDEEGISARIEHGRYGVSTRSDAASSVFSNDGTVFGQLSSHSTSFRLHNTTSMNSMRISPVTTTTTSAAEIGTMSGGSNTPHNPSSSSSLPVTTNTKSSFIHPGQTFIDV